MTTKRTTKGGMEVVTETPIKAPQEITLTPKDGTLISVSTPDEPTSEVLKSAIAQAKVIVDEYAFAPQRPIELVYICSKYTEHSQAQIWLNVNKAVSMGVQVIALGLTPYIPHLSFFVDTACRHRRINVPYKRWMSMTRTILLRCDAMLICGDPANSNGMREEIEVCKNHSIPTFHSIDDLQKAISKPTSG